VKNATESASFAIPTSAPQCWSTFATNATLAPNKVAASSVPVPGPRMPTTVESVWCRKKIETDVQRLLMLAALDWTCFMNAKSLDSSLIEDLCIQLLSLAIVRYISKVIRSFLHIVWQISLTIFYFVLNPFH
jgi:hypothetical protein